MLRLLALAVIDAFAIWFLYQLLDDGVIYLALTVGIITLLINVVFLREDLYPLRWMSPGLALMILMVVYPVLFTVYSAFTNYSDGHILTKQQAIDRFRADVGRCPSSDTELLHPPLSQKHYLDSMPTDGWGRPLHIQCPGHFQDEADVNGNFSLDPEFCDPAQGRFAVGADSPCAPQNSPCGELIGAAWSSDCVTAVARESWGASALSTLRSSSLKLAAETTMFAPVTRQSLPS